jgi:pimeloyl-ACP methyl ester carboxylesterase
LMRWPELDDVGALPTARLAAARPSLAVVGPIAAAGTTWYAGYSPRLSNFGSSRLRCAASPATRPPLRDYLSAIQGPIVLVGHSYGGAVITDAATGNPSVQARVYVDAIAPAEGQ